MHHKITIKPMLSMIYSIVAALVPLSEKAVNHMEIGVTNIDQLYYHWHHFHRGILRTDISRSSKPNMHLEYFVF